MKPQEVTHFHLFGGSGSGAAGFKDADPTIGTIKGKMVLLGGIDVDARACRDFYTLNGVTQACVDLFSVEQYLAWHGHMPPEGVHTEAVQSAAMTLRFLASMGRYEFRECVQHSQAVAAVEVAQ